MDRVIVITGAGGVLCSGFAEYFASLGDKVALLDINEKAVLEVANKISEKGYIARAYKCNVLDKQDIEKVHDKILKELGKCDVLINGAGGNNPKCTTLHEEFISGDETADDFLTFFNIEESGFDLCFDLNLKGVLLPSQCFIKDMIGRDGCCVLNISSMNAYRPLTKIPAYSAAKSAVGNFTQWLAVHFAKQGIRVNAIAPGFFVTNQNRALLFNEDKTPTKRTEKILNATPMARFGEASELNAAVGFLTDSKASSFITGVTLPIDGGFSAYSGV